MIRYCVLSLIISFYVTNGVMYTHNTTRVGSERLSTNVAINNIVSGNSPDKYFHFLSKINFFIPFGYLLPEDILHP